MLGIITKQCLKICKDDFLYIQFLELLDYNSTLERKKNNNRVTYDVYVVEIRILIRSILFRIQREIYHSYYNY